MFKVVREFKDLFDNGYHYEVGKSYPRDGYVPEQKRIEFLLGHIELLGGPAIVRIKEEENAIEYKIEPVEEKQEKADYNSLTVAEIKAILDKQGTEYKTNLKKTELIKLIK